MVLDAEIHRDLLGPLLLHHPADLPVVGAISPQ